MQIAPHLGEDEETSPGSRIVPIAQPQDIVAVDQETGTDGAQPHPHTSDTGQVEKDGEQGKNGEKQTLPMENQLNGFLYVLITQGQYGDSSD